jgi:hypothetical protein
VVGDVSSVPPLGTVTEEVGGNFPRSYSPPKHEEDNRLKEKSELECIAEEVARIQDAKTDKCAKREEASDSFRTGVQRAMMTEKDREKIFRKDTHTKFISRLHDYIQE